MTASDDAGEREQHARVIAEQLEIVVAMQRDLLAYARGETTLLVRKIYLAKFLDDLAKQFRPELAPRGIHMVLDVTNTGVAYLDEQRMARALQNLIRNAIEAMEGKGGTLTLSCSSDGEDVVFRVADTGPGIPKSVRHKLFEPFVTSGKRSGTGLGLANVKKIVEEHAGTVELESSRRGTVFTLRIPSADRPHSLRPHVLEARQRASGTKR
jgi:signal transduction histidine kinase